MTRTPVKGSDAEDDELKEAIAVLIASTRSRRRPLPLTEIARWLEIAVKKLGTYGAVGERIGVSAKMLRQFATVNGLAGPVRQLFTSRRLDSVDAAAHLAMLVHHDQYIVANALAGKTIQTADVRAVVQLRQLEKAAPIEELLRRVVESKTKQQYVAEFVIRGGRTHAELLTAFEACISPGHIIRLEIQGALGRLVLTDEGRHALAKAASNLGTSLAEVIPAILKKSSTRS